VTILVLKQFGTIDRGVMFYMRREDVTLKLISLLVKFVFAACLFYVVKVDNKKQALKVTFLCMLLGALTGGRTYVILPLLIFLMRYRIRFSLITKLASMGFVLFVMLLWKTIVYGTVAKVLFLGEYSLPNTIPTYSISKVEAAGMMSMFIYFLEKSVSPLWLGYSYVEITVRNILPRFITDFSVPALSEQYSPVLDFNFSTNPTDIGFSAMAESWLSFGLLGPVIVGLFFGVLTRFFDKGRKGMAFYIFACFSLRFFRVDFASLTKSWAVAFVGYVCIAHLLFFFAQPLVTSVRSFLRPATWGSKSGQQEPEEGKT
jgi:hypothetical protein